MVRAFAQQLVDLGFNPLVKSYQKTFKNGIYSFPAWRSAFRGGCGEIGPEGRCFLAAWAISISFRNVRQKPNLPTWKGNPSPLCSSRAYYSANALFRVGQCAPVRAHYQQVPKLNIKGLTASKMNVLHHLAVQYEALVILLQETYCTCANKLTIPGFALAASSFSRKHGLATFVHDQLKWTLIDQSPTTSETEWLGMDVDDYRIVNVQKPPSM